MAHAEAHDHHHHHAHGSGVAHGENGSRRSLIISLAVTVGFMAVEAVGGWLTNSLALLSDAGHMLTDAGALGLSWFALRVGEMPPSTTKTFGYRRFEIVAALLNGLALWAIVGLIVREAVGRIASPPEVQGAGMLVIASLGLGVNLVSIWVLHAHKDESLNVRGAFLHVVADSLGSVGALVAGVVILTTGWRLADPLTSLAICGLILWSSWGVVRDSVHVLLEGVPSHLDYRAVEQALLDHDGVCCLYDLHIWAIAGRQEALSVHVVVPDGYPHQRELLRDLVTVLRERFQIEHATLQIEESHEFQEEFLEGTRAVCRLPGEAAPACRIPRGTGTPVKLT
ncbi:MAG: cation transporter [Deltaproteobacteria bacterium]|nr:cation transporter [Deltaproteobacteria bacterium]